MAFSFDTWGRSWLPGGQDAWSGSWGGQATLVGGALPPFILDYVPQPQPAVPVERPRRRGWAAGGVTIKLTGFALQFRFGTPRVRVSPPPPPEPPAAIPWPHIAFAAPLARTGVRLTLPTLRIDWYAAWERRLDRQRRIEDALIVAGGEDLLGTVAGELGGILNGD